MFVSLHPMITLNDIPLSHACAQHLWKALGRHPFKARSSMKPWNPSVIFDKPPTSPCLGHRSRISIIPQKDKQGIHEITMPNSRKNIEINSFCHKLLPQGPPLSLFKIAPNYMVKTIPIILTIMVDFNWMGYSYSKHPKNSLPLSCVIYRILSERCPNVWIWV